MPKIEKMFSLEITVEQFVRNCSDTELQEIFFAADAESNRRWGQAPMKSTLEISRLTLLPANLDTNFTVNSKQNDELQF
jgi:hypothetical protein